MKGIEIFLRKTKYVVISWPNFENIVNNRSSRDVEVDFVIFFYNIYSILVHHRNSLSSQFTSATVVKSNKNSWCDDF